MARRDESTHPNRAAFPDGVSGPALRALASAGIHSIEALSRWSEAEVAALHGMGPKALSLLRDALATSGRRFRQVAACGVGNEDTIDRVRAVRARLFAEGPERSRPIEKDFEQVALPAADCDALRDILIAEGARVVIEIGMAYGASALAIGEALRTTSGSDADHRIIDPFQATAFGNVGWDALVEAGLSDGATLLAAPSSLALPRLLTEGFVADAAFVDGSHRFHEVFVDLYFLRKLVRPGGLVILDDTVWPSVATALRYYDRNLGWQAETIPGRLAARRLPESPAEPAFTDFAPF